MAKGYWVALPATFCTAPNMQAMLAEFGAAGPYAMLTLLSQAELQRRTSGRGAEPGVVKLGWWHLAGLLSVDAPTAEAIVRRLVSLDQIEWVEQGEVSFTARFPDWERWDQSPKDPGAAARKAAQREREKASAPLGKT